MRKPDSLRAWLLRSVPDLAADPDRLHLFVEEGRLVCARGDSLSYEYRYQLTVVIENFAGGAEAISVPLLVWLAQNQHEMIDPEASIPFALDILDNASADHEIKLDLTERVVVAALPDGGWRIEYPPEPEFPVNFESAPARLWQLWASLGNDRDLVAVHPDHLP